MLDRPVNMGWVGWFILLPLTLLAVYTAATDQLLFCTIAMAWTWMQLTPRSTAAQKWLPVLALVLFIACGISVKWGMQWVGPAVCAIALVGATLAKNLDPPVRWLVATIALSAVLIRASGGDFGPDPFSNWLASIGLSPEMAWNVTVFLRKTVHFTYFGLIGWTAYRGVRTLDAHMIWWWPMGWALLNASLDETRQHFVAGRTGSVWDVLLDMAGAATFIALSNRKWSDAPKDLAPESDSPP